MPTDVQQSLLAMYFNYLHKLFDRIPKTDAYAHHRPTPINASQYLGPLDGEMSDAKVAGAALGFWGSDHNLAAQHPQGRRSAEAICALTPITLPPSLFNKQTAPLPLSLLNCLLHIKELLISRCPRQPGPGDKPRRCGFAAKSRAITKNGSRQARPFFVNARQIATTHLSHQSPVTWAYHRGLLGRCPSHFCPAQCQFPRQNDAVQCQVQIFDLPGLALHLV
jgi:hypothetical protein